MCWSGEASTVLVKKKISAPVYFICFIATVCLLLRLYPFEWAPACYEVKTRFIRVKPIH